MSARIRLLVYLCSCLVACGDDAHDELHDAEAEFEGCPDSIPEFELGLTASSQDGAIKAVVREASPVPPARFFNDWTVALERDDDTPVEDASLQSVRAFMPVHGHYGTPDPRVRRRDDEPAVFELEKINLFMRGPWEVKLIVRLPNAGDAEIVFDVCVEE